MQLSHFSIFLVAVASFDIVGADFLENHKKFFSQLENSVEETKTALTMEQLKDISEIVEKIAGFEEGFEFTEPLFEVPKLYIPAAISEYLYQKENFVNKLEILLDDKRGMAFYKEKFDQNIAKPCEEFNRIWAPTLDAFYAIHRSEELFKQIKKYNEDEAQLLLGAGFCDLVMNDHGKSVMNSFIFFGCTLMNPSKGCYI